MPRFSTAFYRRKSTADDLTAVQPSPESPSFRVLERHPSPPPRAFDGGARMARNSGVPMHKPSPSELDVEDNIFAGLNNNRANRGSGSGASNTTKATSTDNSSRHSNASTAPSSADMANNNQDDRGGKRKQAAHETMPRPLTKSSTSSFLDRAGRTFSFGIKSKHHTPPPKQEDVPPLPTFQREDEFGRARAMTASTTSTATPPKLEEESNFDLGGDFGSMFSKFDKRASVATLRMDGKSNPSPSPTKQRPQQPGPVPPPLDIGAAKGPVDSAPPSWNSQNSYQSKETLMSPPKAAQYDLPPPVPRHQPSFEYRSVKSPGSPMEDEDARLLADSVAAAGKFLTTEIPEHAAVDRYGRDEDDFTVMGRGSDFSREDNMFAGTSSQFSRTTIREAPRPANASSDNPNSRVMTPAEFERYRRDKEREGLEKAAYGEPADDDDDEDPINYDDEEDEDDKLKQQAKQRRNQQAQMTAYRQRNMKTTGELAITTPISPGRPTLGTSLSAPHLAPNKTPSPEPGHAIDEDEDEDVPLAILQAHGFPNKGRAPSRLTSFGSNPNLRASTILQPGRPASVVGEPASNASKRFSTLPAFARNLPQDPFVGAGIARPAVRESMSFGIGSPQPPPQQSPSMHPGGLIGVIATEERNRAMRRGSPNLESQRAHFGGGMDPMMFNGGMRMPPQQQPQNASQLSVQDQAQLQMSQQMSSFLQMQMQFMQMMAGQQQNGSPQMLQQMSPPMMQQQMMGSPPGQQQPYGGFAGSQSVADFQSGQSFGGSPPLTQPRRMDASMRTMSMIQPSSSSFMGPAFGNGMGPGAGYSPSIAPSERSNIGLPGRYRPVSQAGSLTGPNFLHQRTQSMSGATALSSFATPDDSKVVPTVKLVSEAKNSNNHSDDEDDEEGWAAMKAKREQKKSRWRLKKGSTDLF
ncbi:unnamed protein product [Clonostachys rosea]|uniref:Uncharacterized protein n=1 Tax=Bionectria ochroleuca TaxID=29856 RepID=A0ABY6TSR9_BIOOC|nr:unnamed protein product [Clonostachys rosea]